MGRKKKLKKLQNDLLQEKAKSRNPDSFRDSDQVSILTAASLIREVCINLPYSLSNLI